MIDFYYLLLDLVMNEFEKYISEYSYERLINLKNDMYEYWYIHKETGKLSGYFALMAMKRINYINKKIHLIDRWNTT